MICHVSETTENLPSPNNGPRITAMAGGIGGARFLRGLQHQLALRYPDGQGGTTADLTVIGNTGDDIWLFGVKICPDLDTVMYTLGNGINEEQGWGRIDESFVVKSELLEYGATPDWFGLGDRDLATHLLRTQLLTSGVPLSQVTARLCERWKPGVRLIPMSDQRTESHVVVDDPSGSLTSSGEPVRTAIHFQEWWIKHRASLPAHELVLVGCDEALPAPGVIDAIENADVIVLPPSNPVVSIGTILSIAGIREAVANAKAPVVGVSPIIGNSPVRGMADACLTAIGVQTSPTAVAEHYGARSQGGILDGWLIDTSDADSVAPIESMGIATRAVPLYMTDVQATSTMASDLLDLAESIRK
jgi:LPPG:FO 2-phospho-L-lactate transferase